MGFKSGDRVLHEQGNTGTIIDFDNEHRRAVVLVDSSRNPYKCWWGFDNFMVLGGKQYG